MRGCQAAVQFTGNAAFEWEPAFGAAHPLLWRGFTLTFAKGPTLETVGRTQIVCTRASATGEITGPATIGLGGLKLTGCQSRTLGGCRGSGAAAGEIQTGALDGQLGTTSVDSNPTKDTVGVELSPASGEAIAELSCGASPITVRGAVMLAPGTANRMKSKTIWKGVEHKGVQKLMQFVEGLPVRLEAKIGAGAYEQTGLKLTADGEDEVDVEFNTVF